MRRVVFLAVALCALAGCGSRVPLVPPPGGSLPIKGETASTQENSDQLMTPDTQARPKRGDEQLKRSEERRQDKFDLPPV